MKQLMSKDMQNHLRLLRYPKKIAVNRLEQSARSVLENFGYEKELSEEVASSFCTQYTLHKRNDEENM